MNKWKIYYKDGTTFSSNDGPISNAPKTGVIWVQHRIPSQLPERATIVGNAGYADYYKWEPIVGEFQGMDIFGVIDSAVEAGLITSVTPGNPTTYQTAAGELDTVGLILWLCEEQGFIFRGEYVDRETFNTIKVNAQKDAEIRMPDEIKDGDIPAYQPIK